MRHNLKVSIIILNWNSKKVTLDCLNSLLNGTDYPKNLLNIILVDNGSTDGSKEIFNENFSREIDLISLNENLGFIKGNNLGISYALEKFNPDYILLLNSDTLIVQKDWLKILVETAEKDEKIGIVGPKLMFPNGKIQWSGKKTDKNPISLILQTMTARNNPGFAEFEKNAPYSNFTGEVNTISGACMLIKMELIRNIGLLDVSLCPMYQEDVEYSFRAWKNGYKVMYNGNIKVVHYEGYSSNNGFKSNENVWKEYLALRNSIIVSLRYIGRLNTLIFGFPFFIFALFFDKKQKTEKLSIKNIKFKDNPLRRVLGFVKFVRDMEVK